VDGNQWKIAIRDHIHSLEQFNPWLPVDKLHEGAKVIGTKWVFVYKLKDGEFDKRKARLTMLGFMQRYGIEYNNAFAPVTGVAVIRLLVVIQTSKGMKVKQYDFSDAFKTTSWRKIFF